MIRWFQIKKLSITKFHYISRSTTFILVVFPSEIVWKILILKFKHSFAWQDDFKPKHCQLQSFITLKYLQLSCWWFFSFWGCFQNSNFKFFKFRRSSRWQDDFTRKSFQLQNSITSQDLQILFWLFGHLFISHDGSNNMHKSYTSLIVS
jgi:hypothetical protein